MELSNSVRHTVFFWFTLTFFTNKGAGLSCYSCAWDSRGQLHNHELYGVPLSPHCAVPFSSDNLLTENCTGVCIYATAIVKAPILGEDAITLRTCAGEDSCRQFGDKLRELVDPLPVARYSCSACQVDLCNAAPPHPTPVAAILLAAIVLAQRFLH